MRYLIVPAVILFFPELASAQFGLIACGGVECQACHLVDTANNVIRFLISILGTIGVLLFIFGGFLFLTARDDTSQVDKAKGILIDVVIGFIIVLAAWLIVDTVMKNLLPSGQVQFGSGDFGPWNEIRCVAQPEYEGRGRISATGALTGELLSPEQIAEARNRIVSDTEITEDVLAAAAAVGLTDLNQINAYRGLVYQESGNCRSVVGPDTGKGRGRAYGCTQFLISTAKEVDKKLGNKFAGMSDAEIATFLQSSSRENRAYSILMGAQYFKDGLTKYEGNIDFALARYNGGDAAMNPSNTCPGKTWYQCEANSGYAETRNYVSRIKQYSADLTTAAFPGGF